MNARADDSMSSLANHLLVAMPGLGDRNFNETVTLLCEHNAEGALGIVINRPTELTLGDLAQHMELEVADLEAAERPVLSGGPVQVDHGFVLHEPLGDWESTLRVTETLGLTTSRDVLAAILAGAGPERWLIALGYAGWGPGQLEQELAQNAWLTVPADRELIFETPFEARWQETAARLGVDLKLIAGEAGHA